MSSANFQNSQTELRLAMQRNGYAWVPNNGKRTRGTDWPEKALKRPGNESMSSALWWDNPRDDAGLPIDVKNPSTGLLIEGDLVALDVDIDNKDAVGGVFDLACSIFGEAWAEEVLVRHRKGSHKECWVFRVDPPEKGDTPFRGEGKIVGPKYWPPGTADDVAAGEHQKKPQKARPDGYGSPQTIEIFRGGRCQVGALGWHTVPDAEKGIEGIEYEWLDSETPATVRRDDLPKVSHAQLFNFYERYGEVLDNKGWVKDTSPTGGDGATYVYDLPSGPFYTGTKHYPEAIDYAALDTGDNVRMFEIVGEGTNPLRGHCFKKSNGVVGVFDRENGVWHYPPSEDPELPKVQAAKLGEALAKLARVRADDDVPSEGGVTQRAEADDDEASGNDEAPRDDFEEVLTLTMELLAASGVNPSVEDEDLDAVMEAYHKATGNWLKREPQTEARAQLLALRWQYVDFYATKVAADKWQCLMPGKAKSLSDAAFLTAYDEVAEVIGPSQPVRVTSIFTKSKLPVKIEGLKFIPTSSHRIAKNEHGYLVENTFKPPMLGTATDELVQLYQDFTKHIFDREDELAIFHECMSHKFLHPTGRGVTHILVADGIEGVGRNTLVEQMLFSALGRANCAAIDANRLNGSGQAAYTAWQLDTLMFFVPELTVFKRASMDGLKALCEPQSNEVVAAVKYGTDRRDKTYGTMIMATNHSDALPLDMRTDNRRFNVYDNGANGPLLANRELKKRVDAVRTADGGVTPDMAASIHHFYTVVWPERNGAPRQEVFMTAADTVAKRKMAEETKKPSDHYIEDVLDKIEGAGLIYVEVGYVISKAQEAARRAQDGEAVKLIPGELKKMTSGGGGVKGWLRVRGPDGGDRLNLGGGAKKAVLAKGRAAADAFLAMPYGERDEVLKKASQAGGVAGLRAVVKAVGEQV